MATKTIVQNLDDVDGREGASTHTFALDGVSYEIDLVDPNFARLYDGLIDFIENARRTGRVKAKANGASSVVAVSDTRIVRQWWREHPEGLPVFTERGRVPQTVHDAYKGQRPGTVAEVTPTAPEAAPKNSRSKHPGDAEVERIYRQVGTIKGVADYFNVAYPTASKWVAPFKKTS